VTPKHVRGNGNQTYIPDDRLIQRYSSSYGWEPTKLTAVLSRFGRLPEAGQEQLICCLVLALGWYQMRAKRAKSAQRVTPSNLRNQLAGVEATARKLLLQLGVNSNDVAVRAFWDSLSDRPPSERLRLLGKQSVDGSYVTSQLAFAGINTGNKDIAAVNVELREASDCVADAVISLLDLHERAKTAAQIATKRIAPGRGGSRHHPNAKGQLIRHAITIYAHMRSQHPDSGNKAGYGGPMLRFIHVVAGLYRARVLDSDIRDVWRVWKSNRK
jgi:hypothetical protein